MAFAYRRESVFNLGTFGIIRSFGLRVVFAVLGWSGVWFMGEHGLITGVLHMEIRATVTGHEKMVTALKRNRVAAYVSIRF